METIIRRHAAPQRLPGHRPSTLVGVVASGNLEVLAERTVDDQSCSFHVSTAVSGFEPVWDAVLSDFAQRYAPGGVAFSINDGGARPDTVLLRLAQACQALKEDK
ncbi:malonate decarboxylase acyl carrier protein [Bordetella bronchialis]|uniref:Malonate decarboxylase acyl carrier protein n=1 Tax=Bordetella bronchialis TaxID=463025 RepID=A0A193FMJ0_9BORD|nr:malonate decarboxylase acyl carrier protein [Bordetella bronchialis]ANN68972.1 malonate decarboxylase acyl carrier protein [Bordetella bronchialis]ANN74121.1 malonate decarboxylase acyl carrier protein [Bordetella bronchialis]